MDDVRAGCSWRSAMGPLSLYRSCSVAERSWPTWGHRKLCPAICSQIASARRETINDARALVVRGKLLTDICRGTSPCRWGNFRRWTQARNLESLDRRLSSRSSQRCSLHSLRSGEYLQAARLWLEP